MGPAAADTSQKTGPGPVRATPEASGGSTQTCTHKKGTANLPTVPYETVAVPFLLVSQVARGRPGRQGGCLGCRVWRQLPLQPRTAAAASA